MVFVENRQKKCKVRTEWKLLLITAALAAVGAVLLSYMRPVILAYAQTVAKRMLLSAANEAVVNVLRETNTDYDDLVRLSPTRTAALQVCKLTRSPSTC